MSWWNPFSWGGGDSTSYTSQPNGGAAPVGTLAYQAVDPSQNSLEQYLRSLTNYGGNQAQSYIGQGNTLLNQGTGYVTPAASYWQNILTGNPGAATSLMQPEIQAVNAGYNNAQHQAAQYAPMGGGRSSLMQQLPYQRVGAVSNLIAQARPMAAQNLAQIGAGQQQLGLGYGQLGSQDLFNTLQSLYSGRGQDITEQGQNKALAGSLASDLTNGLVAGFKGGSGGGGGNG